jgi:hypothetical protein
MPGVAAPASPALAAHWQSRLDTAVVIAALGALVSVALQTLSGVAQDIGVALSWAVWIVFAVDIGVMLRVSPDRAAWARSHVFEIAVLALAWPLWALVAHDLLAIELVPVLSVLQATKLAKLAKAVRILRRRAPATTVTTVAAVVLVVAAAVAVRVVAKGH